MRRSKKIVLSGLMIAIGLVLPIVTMEIPDLGSALLPMHLPVLLCGFLCGWPWGLAVGLVLPVFRSLLFGMPPLFPTAVAMTFELAVYGFMTGLLYRRLPKRPQYVYVTLIAAMLAGRLVWGAVSYLLYGLAGSTFTMALFLGGAFAEALPGIVIQLILIPVLIFALKGAGLVDHRRT